MTGSSQPAGHHNEWSRNGPGCGSPLPSKFPSPLNPHLGVFRFSLLFFAGFFSVSFCTRQCAFDKPGKQQLKWQRRLWPPTGGGRKDFCTFRFLFVAFRLVGGKGEDEAGKKGKKNPWNVTDENWHKTAGTAGCAVRNYSRRTLTHKAAKSHPNNAFPHPHASRAK